MLLAETITPWPTISVLIGLLDIALTIFVVGVILSTKHDSTSAVAWCMTVIYLPVIGMILFFVFGRQSVHRRMMQKKQRTKGYRRSDGTVQSYQSPESIGAMDPHWYSMSQYASNVEAFPLTTNNQVTFYHHATPAFQAMIDAIESAKHHIHIEFFIFRSDESGKRFVDALARKAKEGVEVRFLYDAVGAHDLSRKLIREVCDGGGKCLAFMSLLNPLRRFRVNLRNHRKLLIVDGKIGFAGGMNIGDEYQGKSPRFGEWRDTHLRLEGPSVSHLQETFIEDWHFAADELLKGEKYYPEIRSQGNARVQVVKSGPDQAVKSIRQVYFAAILKARKRIWIASPYFVPDMALIEALTLAARNGVDVRLIMPFRPDKWIPFLAGRYYVQEMLACGVSVYQYTAGFMHAKMMIIDDGFGCVGSANFDNRSLHLNFEVNCVFYSPITVTELEGQFLTDMGSCIRIDPDVYKQRPYLGKLAENACRMLSPIL